MKKIIILTIISLFINAFVFLLRQFDFLFISIVCFVCYFFVSYISTIKIKIKWAVFSAISIGIIASQFLFGFNMESLTNIIFYCAATFMGCLFYDAKKYIKIVIIIISIFANVICYNFLFSVNQANNIINNTDKKYNIPVGERIVFDIDMLNENGESIKFADLEGEIKILIFWDNTVISENEISEYAHVYQQFNNRDNIKFYTVFCYDKFNINKKGNESYEVGKQYLKEKKYLMPILATPLQKKLLENLGLLRIPEILVLNSQEILLFKGNASQLREYLSK